MSKLIVGFSKPKKWKPFAKLIQFAYGINYDHVYIKLDSPRLERTLIYQASKSMVNFMGSVVFENDNVTLKEVEFEITPEIQKKVLQFAIDNAGKPYGAKACLGLAIVRIFELFGKIIKNPFCDGNITYFCSELVSIVLTELDIKLPKDPENMTPKDVYKLIINN